MTATSSSSLVGFSTTAASAESCTASRAGNRNGGPYQPTGAYAQARPDGAEIVGAEPQGGGYVAVDAPTRTVTIGGGDANGFMEVSSRDGICLNGTTVLPPGGVGSVGGRGGGTDPGQPGSGESGAGIATSSSSLVGFSTTAASAESCTASRAGNRNGGPYQPTGAYAQARPDGAEIVGAEPQGGGYVAVDAPTRTVTIGGGDANGFMEVSSRDGICLNGTTVLPPGGVGSVGGRGGGTDPGQPGSGEPLAGGGTSGSPSAGEPAGGAALGDTGSNDGILGKLLRTGAGIATLSSIALVFLATGVVLVTRSRSRQAVVRTSGASAPTA